MAFKLPTPFNLPGRNQKAPSVASSHCRGRTDERNVMKKTNWMPKSIPEMVEEMNGEILRLSKGDRKKQAENIKSICRLYPEVGFAYILWSDDIKANQAEL